MFDFRADVMVQLRPRLDYFERVEVERVEGYPVTALSLGRLDLPVFDDARLAGAMRSLLGTDCEREHARLHGLEVVIEDCDGARVPGFDGPRYVYGARLDRPHVLSVRAAFGFDEDYVEAVRRALSGARLEPALGVLGREPGWASVPAHVCAAVQVWLSEPLPAGESMNAARVRAAVKRQSRRFMFG